MKMRLTISRLSLLVLLTVFLPATLHAADRLYFASLVEHMPAKTPRIISIWGSLEGEIPQDILAFTLYRKVDGGSFTPVAKISNRVADPAVIRQTILADPNQSRTARLLTVLEDIRAAEFSSRAVITETNFAEFLYNLLEPASSDFNPLQRMLLCRAYPGVAQAAGLSYVDNGPFEQGGKLYSYMLTAMTAAGESLPIGRSEEVDPQVPDVLPAPTGLSQVQVGGCSDIRQNLDDLRIHMSWDVPDQASELSEKILTYGYDLFWSTDELSGLDLNQAIPASLHRVNSKPIVVSGPPTGEGPESYLARDSQDSHSTGPEWRRGQQYFYYIASLDIAGRYSAVSGPFLFTVTDRQAPPPPWRLHSEESASVSGTASTPQLNLVWDQINQLNYVRYFGSDRVVCSSDTGSVCTAPTADACSKPGRQLCVDLDVDHYLVFRFPSPEAASAWGQDSDNDLWPDQIERRMFSDPCDPLSRPGNADPVELAAVIAQDDTSKHRLLNDSPEQPSKFRQILFNDSVDNLSDNIGPEDYDKVFYYRVMAVDGQGNQSALSPPIRGVLHNREQPAAVATLEAKDCTTFSAVNTTSTEFYAQGDLLTLVDNSHRARSYQLVKHCSGDLTGQQYQPPYTQVIATGYLDGDITHLTAADITTPYGCEDDGCSINTGYTLTFYDESKLPMASTSSFVMADVCTSFSGTVTLDPNCSWASVDSPNRVAAGDLKICTPLTAGQTARVYMEIDGEMSPVENIAYTPDPENSNDSCIVLSDLGGIQDAGLCLGVRTFSKNHVGSVMYYLNCVEKAQASRSGPPAPMVEGIHSRGERGTDPSFTINWSSALYDQAAFVLALTSGDRSYYKTIYDIESNSSGQFSFTHNLDPAADLDREWCVRLRTIDSTMSRSPWSEEQCATWAGAVPEKLPWPAVQEPEESGTMRAFFIQEGTSNGRPALLLSDDLSPQLNVLACNGQSCSENVPDCDGTAICVDRILENGKLIDEPVIFELFDGCGLVAPQIKVKHFLVYRQEEGRDFVQTSPLIKPFTCKNIVKVIYGTTQNDITFLQTYQMRDSFLFLRDFSSGAVTMDGTDPETGLDLTGSMITGSRLFYLDRYPFVSGTRVRYKVVVLDPVFQEPRQVMTSNWLTLP